MPLSPVAYDKREDWFNLIDMLADGDVSRYALMEEQDYVTVLNKLSKMKKDADKEKLRREHQEARNANRNGSG